MKYNNHLNYKKRKRFLLKVRLFMALLIVVLVAGGLMFYLKYVRNSDANTQDAATTDSTRSYIAPKINIFRTPYFQFQADEPWVEVPSSSSGNRFVYSYVRNNLIEHEFTVYVNQIPANLSASRVLPITVETAGDGTVSLVSGRISEHCSKVAPPEKIARVSDVSMKSVQFKCDNVTPNYSVLAGVVGGTTVFDLKRSDEAIVSYALYYQNLRADGEGSQFIKIINSFQAR